jgi:hypothetical protein
MWPRVFCPVELAVKKSGTAFEFPPQKKKKLIKRTDGHDHIGQMKVLFLSQRVCNE